MTPRLLVVIGTPLPATLTHSLAAAYIESARAAGADVRVIDLANDPIPGHPTSRAQLRAPRTDDDVPLDPAVAAYLDDVRWADRIVLVFPQWWGTYPAALKAFIDRVFLSGAAFRYREHSPISERLLAGRTARLIMTMDSPRWWNRLAYRNAAETSLKNAVLRYCGIRTVGITRFTPVRFSDEPGRTRWVAEAARLGRMDAVASVARTREGAVTPA